MNNIHSKKIEIIQRKLFAYLGEIELIGCTLEDLKQLKEIQRVVFLPQIYIQLMLIMGKQGINYALGGRITCKELEIVKAVFSEELKDVGIDFPDDIFIFYGDSQGSDYYFFRTNSRQDDPVVYEYVVGSACFHKLAERFSDFVILELDLDRSQRLLKRKQRRLEKLYFDPELDEFLRLPPTSWDTSLPFEKAMETIFLRYKDELQGCTETDIEQIKHLQNVLYLPESYSLLLHLAGKSVIDEILHGQASYEHLKRMKELFDIFSRLRKSANFPQDIFVFARKGRSTFLFFRTKDRESDPAVYLFEPGGHLFKQADTFTEFVLQELDPERKRRLERQEDRQQLVYYDSKGDRILPSTASN